MEIMQVGFAFAHELFAYPNREWKVGDPASMQMADLAPSDVKEHHAAAISLYRDPGP